MSGARTNQTCALDRVHKATETERQTHGGWGTSASKSFGFLLYSLVNRAPLIFLSGIILFAFNVVDVNES